jgi:hypothetical protein
VVIHQLDAAPPPDLQRALQEFEASFLIPFTPGRFFRIDYGGDRTAFIRSLGEGRCFAGEKDGRIVGLIEIAVVNLLLPGGEARTAGYIADIKVRPEDRRKMGTARLLQKAMEWGQSKTDFGFTVTLDETPIKPSDYTGRAGILKFSEAGRLVVVRLPAANGAAVGEGGRRFVAKPEDAREIFKRLSKGRYALLGGSPGDRSDSPPAWLAHPSGLACARFEDRRKVRRLIADDGVELRPAYLSCFAFQDPRAALELIGAAAARAGALGFRALRICLPPSDLAQLRPGLGSDLMVGGGGSVFATAAAKEKAPWNLNAAEI